jgi:hypothetical protein
MRIFKRLILLVAGGLIAIYSMNWLQGVGESGGYVYGEGVSSAKGPMVRELLNDPVYDRSSRSN